MQIAVCSGFLRRFSTKTLSACLKGMADKKTLLTMRLTALLLFIACLQASADGFSQNISLSVHDAPLERVFDKIKAQSGYTFVYTRDMLRKSKRVTLTVNNAPLELVLQLCFTGQPLEYTILNRMIIVKEKEISITPANENETLPPPPIDVKGRIVNDKGDPVMATIAVKGSDKITGTDENGYFELKDIDQNAVLVITGVGIATKEIAVKGRSDLSVIPVKIKATPMDEMQVIAYGVTSKRFLVGAVTTVKSEDITKQPVTNVLLALQGRVPGLIVTPGNGAPGTTVRMQVRGQNTLASSGNFFTPYDQPLIIIDGVPFSPQNQNINLIPSMGAGNGGGFLGFSALSNINPNDIESITVLRDADATSIYGSQGSNGVVLITTKKGTPGKTRLTVRVNTGPNKTTRRYEYMNTAEYLQLRKEAIANDGLTLPPVYNGEFPDLQLFDSSRNTDWFKQFFGGTSNNTDIQTSLTGGSENLSFILSAGYNVSKYNFPGDFAEKRMSLHSGFRYQSKNNKLTLDFITDFSYGHNNNAYNPQITQINALPPNTPELLDAAGNLVWNYKGLDLGYNVYGITALQYQHYGYLKQPYDLRKYNLNNSLQLSYKLFQGFSAAVNIGYSRFNSSETSKIPIGSQSPNSPFGRAGSAYFTKNEFETINIEPQLNYQRTIGKGVLTLLSGATYKRNLNDNETIGGVLYTNDGFLNSLTGAGSIVGATSNNILYKYIGVYGRAGYIYDNKYILNITGRRDGSSNFGPGRQFGTFASAGVGWIISEENFFSDWKPSFSLLKLSANYGTNGSDGVEPYNYQEYWRSEPAYGANFMGIRPYTPLNPYNPDYSWALKRSLNIMLDIGFFNDRLLLNANWYRSRTGNQLVGVILPSQTGFTSVTDNLAATVQNSGWEVSLSSTNFRNDKFAWTTNFNFSINRNKLIAFPDLEKSAYFNTYVVGQSLNIVNLIRYKGVNPTTGLFEFYDSKGNATYNPSYELEQDGGDRAPLLDQQPGYTGGIDNSFAWKGFTLSVFFQFAKQTAWSPMIAIYGSGYVPGMLGNQPVLVRNRWQKPGDIATFQKATAGYSNEANASIGFLISSTAAYSDASYLRLKTLAISYDFPAAFVKKAGMESLKLYASAQNLLTFTPYEFGDPEVPGTLTVPLQRTIAFGLLFNF